MDLNTVTDWLKNKVGYVPQPEKQLPEGSPKGIRGKDLPLVLGMIAGPMAVGANMSKYRDAAKAVLNKERPTSIFNRTGWFQRQPGQLAFEIPDAKYFTPEIIRPPPGDRTWEGTIGRVGEHPPLFKSYPGISKVPVMIGPEVAKEGEGFFGPSGIGIGGRIGPQGLTRQQLRTLMHETGHEVQYREGWGSGIDYGQLQKLTPRSIANRYYEYDTGDPARDELAKLLKTFLLNQPSTIRKMYLKNPQETESRNIENRFANQMWGEPFMSANLDDALGRPGKALNLTPAQVKYPWMTEDIPRTQQFDYSKILGLE